MIMENKAEMQQLLERLEKSGQQQAKYAKLQFIFSISAVAICLVFVILALMILPQAHDMVSRTEVLLQNLETATEKLAETDLDAIISNVDSLVSNVDSLVSNADSLVSTGQGGMQEALEAIEKIDFEKLNDAIEGFSAVVEPLAKFFNIFDR